MKPEKILYEATMTAAGGRDGKVSGPDGNLSLDLSIPKQLGGPGGAGTNPEELFAAGYSACFLSALKLTGRLNKTPLPEETSVSATVGVGQVDVGYGLAVKLHVNIPQVDRALAEELVKGAHARCPYSRATANNIDVSFSVSTS